METCDYVTSPKHKQRSDFSTKRNIFNKKHTNSLEVCGFITPGKKNSVKKEEHHDTKQDGKDLSVQQYDKN